MNEKCYMKQFKRIKKLSSNPPRTRGECQYTRLMSKLFYSKLYNSIKQLS